MPRPTRGTGIGRGGRGLGRMEGNKPGSGPCGECICFNCGARIPHQIGIPCYSLTCSKCGSKMGRR